MIELTEMEVLDVRCRERRDDCDDIVREERAKLEFVVDVQQRLVGHCQRPPLDDVSDQLRHRGSSRTHRRSRVLGAWPGAEVQGEAGRSGVCSFDVFVDEIQDVAEQTAGNVGGLLAGSGQRIAESVQ